MGFDGLHRWNSEEEFDKMNNRPVYPELNALCSKQRPTTNMFRFLTMTRSRIKSALCVDSVNACIRVEFTPVVGKVVVHVYCGAFVARWSLPDDSDLYANSYRGHYWSCRMCYNKNLPILQQKLNDIAVAYKIESVGGYSGNIERITFELTPEDIRFLIAEHNKCPLTPI